MSRDLGWYVHRLRRMSPGEVVTRVGDEARRTAWASNQVMPGDFVLRPRGVREPRGLAAPLPPDARDSVSPQAADLLVAAADRLLVGDWSLLGTPRPDIAAPDWFLDPGTGRRAPQHELSFAVDHRDEGQTGNVKVVWELSRHHHLTVLAAAWWLTGDDRYAEIVGDQLQSWWRDNPFLSGVHWTSGIELGVRLVSWAWIRRLLDEWPKVKDLFDDNDLALAQIWWHQRYLECFRSSGSSANNHAVAEACGRLVAACAFPWYAETDGWRAEAARELRRSLAANTFPSGVNRELASDYHRFVTELGLVAAAEADAAGHPLGAETWKLLVKSLDAAAAMVDCTGRPPRQGDGDEGRALLLDDPEGEPWAQLLDLGGQLVGTGTWWPPASPTVAGALVRVLHGVGVQVLGRPNEAPQHFADAGITLLRTRKGRGPEIWCRCDGGPHGHLSIAAHAHADALSVEVRYGGVDILVDPGTYCYHGEPQWRSYFRSTLAHNTVEIDGLNQSVEAGPFLWSSHATTREDRAWVGPLPVQSWTAHHTGYDRLQGGVGHTRSVSLDRNVRELTIADHLKTKGLHTIRMAYHLGPAVDVELSGTHAELGWVSPRGLVQAGLQLPKQLSWSAHRAETNPILGWYSPRFGEKVPTWTLVGSGQLDGSLCLWTTLAFAGVISQSPADGKQAGLRSKMSTVEGGQGG
ncbi:MAG TPA: alginate lyase family protein [Intrasporangium sp.]|nr:alginate lyase family protein [Intrasporangium sp.]